MAPNKHDELLIRIDERVGKINDTVAKISQELKKNTEMTNAHNHVLFGCNGVEGVYKKVERLDRIYLKMTGLIMAIVMMWELGKEWIQN